MSAIQRYIKSSSPLSKTLMAVAITSALVVFHRMVYKPYATEKRYKAAEKWANMIIEQEERMQQESEEDNSF